MRARVRAARRAAAVVVWSGVLLAGCAEGKAPPRAHRVAIQNFLFRPATLTVAAGDTVVWANEDFVPHTATAQGGTFDSGNLDAKGEWRWVAGAPGSYAYVCTLHPTMKGEVVVR